MEETRKPHEGVPHALQGPHWDRSANGAATNFVPLRLVLLPSGLSVDFTRPEIVVGRHSSADVRLPLPDVSRRHCRFVFSNGAWQIYDLGSLNGIFVNGLKVDKAVLRDRDGLNIGGFRFVVEIKADKHADCGSPDDMIQSIADVLVPPILELGEQQRKAS
jgi:pSer/pThr/pTyr-binding forkhead associated (FHA) protein